MEELESENQKRWEESKHEVMTSPARDPFLIEKEGAEMHCSMLKEKKALLQDLQSNYMADEDEIERQLRDEKRDRSKLSFLYRMKHETKEYSF